MDADNAAANPAITLPMPCDGDPRRATLSAFVAGRWWPNAHFCHVETLTLCIPWHKASTPPPPGLVPNPSPQPVKTRHGACHGTMHADILKELFEGTSV